MDQKLKKTAGLSPSVRKQGKKIGNKIRNQLNLWFDPDNEDRSKVTLPEDPKKVLVAIDSFDVPVIEKKQMQSAILFGLKNTHTVIFMNNIINR